MSIFLSDSKGHLYQYINEQLIWKLCYMRPYLYYLELYWFWTCYAGRGIRPEIAPFYLWTILMNLRLSISINSTFMNDILFLIQQLASEHHFEFHHVRDLLNSFLRLNNWPIGLLSTATAQSWYLLMQSSASAIAFPAHIPILYKFWRTTIMVQQIATKEEFDTLVGTVLWRLT